ncbi:MAG: sialate O-acetylesterase [Oscillospiraceae bacterium]|nr:sialate O-acetylesterase [Oscillospiraceae bacterium]
MLKLAPIFKDHLVLQREKPLHIWGNAEDGSLITAAIGSVSAQAETVNGAWHAVLPPLPAGGPYTLTVSDGSETLSLNDVMLGEVWLCGGQSNMELVVKDAAHPGELLRDCEESGVRLYHVGKRGFFDAQFYAEEEASCWQLPMPDTTQHWTAVGYLFAQELAKKLGVTIGLVECCYGGTSATAWMSEAMLQSTEAGRRYLADYENGIAGLTDEEANQAYRDYCVYQNAWNERLAAFYREHPTGSWEEALAVCGENRYPGPYAPINPLRPHGLYDTMLRRITPFTLRGVLYYQAESDDHRPEDYETLLTCLIREWRQDFRDPALPFLLVQLPMYAELNTAECVHWAKLRLAQERVYRADRHAGMAVILDCGEYCEIHPKEKRPPAHRLFLQALREVYGLQEADTTSPLLRSAIPESGGIRLHFDTTSPLELRGSEGFEICGADGIWHSAAPSVNENTLLLTSPEVPYPAEARYAWYNFGPVTLFAKNGLPAAPFNTSRTDC